MIWLHKNYISVRLILVWLQLQVRHIRQGQRIQRNTPQQAMNPAINPHHTHLIQVLSFLRRWLITNDSDHLIGTLSDPGICQENDVIRQGVQQLQNKINQFQRRDGLGGSPLIRDSDYLNFRYFAIGCNQLQSVAIENLFTTNQWLGISLNSSESLTTTSLPMTQWEWLCLF